MRNITHLLCVCLGNLLYKYLQQLMKTVSGTRKFGSSKTIQYNSHVTLNLFTMYTLQTTLIFAYYFTSLNIYSISYALLYYQESIIQDVKFIITEKRLRCKRGQTSSCVGAVKQNRIRVLLNLQRGVEVRSPVNIIKLFSRIHVPLYVHLWDYSASLYNTKKIFH